MFERLSNENKPADTILSAYFSEHKYLGSSDRKLLSESIFDLLRKELRYVKVLDRFFSQEHNKPIKKAHAVIALYMLEHNPLNLSPKNGFSELNLTVNEQNNLWDAYLSICEDIKIGDTASRLGFEYAFPEWIIRHLLENFEVKDLERLLESFNQSARVVLRANGYKANAEALKVALENEGIETSLGKLSSEALICKKRSRIFQSQAFKKGLCEIQDEGSQLISLILNPKPKEKVLDACAGGGGKSLHLASLMNGKGTVFAYDLNIKRFGNIKQRIKRSGLQNIQLLDSKSKLSWFKTHYGSGLDAILIDAPCSGSGTLRRNPDIKKRLQQDAIKRLNSLQINILNEYSGLLKNGGRMVYATCSILSSENECVVESFVAKNPQFKIIHLGEDICQRKGYFITEAFKARVQDERFLKLRPDFDGSDGFFAALIEKKP